MPKYLLALLLTTSVATAQTVCGDHQAITDALGVRYEEQKQAAGMASQSQVVEIYANLETGTWTIISVRTDGMACLVAAGEVWLTFDPEPIGEPM